MNGHAGAPRAKRAAGVGPRAIDKGAPAVNGHAGAPRAKRAAGVGPRAIDKGAPAVNGHAGAPRAKRAAGVGPRAIDKGAPAVNGHAGAPRAERAAGVGPRAIDKGAPAVNGHTPAVKVLVTGARGQLAGAIIHAYKDTARVLAYSRAELDIADFDAVVARVCADRPDVIINCAAYNNVDQAEDDPERALTVNAFGVRVLARVATDIGAMLVHYSTDFVFDGCATRPYTEDDPPNPQSVYAQSKLLGEWFAFEAPRAFVLRVESLFGGDKPRSSVDRIVHAIANGEEAKVFSDRTVSPSYVADVAMATKVLVERGAPGLYHCVGTGHGTWLDVGREIARIMGKEGEARLTPVSVAHVSLRAPRPQFAALANEKLNRIVTMSSWQDALQRYLT